MATTAPASLGAARPTARRAAPAPARAVAACCSPAPRRAAAVAGPTSSRRSVAASAAATDAPPASKKTPPMPFVRLADQEEMKLALLLNVVDPAVGGVLIMGDRGTGKSVAVRAVAELLPDLDVVPGDPFNSSPTDPKLMGPDAMARFRAGESLPVGAAKTPLVELPLGATEDRICGTIDIEKALSEGVKAYEPGLLARANRGILYVDEVNLLDDGLVDVVLDAAAGGVNTVEREGVSISHPARFIMVGSGNPAEGELRPQLLDRFGLAVNVGTMPDLESRTRMVLDRMAYDADPAGFAAAAEAEQEALRAKLADARSRLPSVAVPRDVRLVISKICSLLDVDGIRGDIVTNKAARALVALEGRAEVTNDDVRRVIGLCLNHRLRKDVLDSIDNGYKVALAFKRITNPKAAEREAAEAAEAKAKEAEANKKAGSWAGLPGMPGGAKASAPPPEKKAGAWGGLPGR